MAVLKKDTKKEKTKSEALITFNSYLDDYFGLIILATVLLVLLLSATFVLYPRFGQAKDTIMSAQKFLDDQEQQIDMYDRKIDAYLSDYRGIDDEDKIKVNDMIAPKIRYSSLYHTDLIIMLSDLLESDGFSIEEMTVSQSQERQIATNNKKVISRASEGDVTQLPPGVFAVNVSVTLEEISYRETKRLLSILESRQRLVDVVNVGYDPEGATATLGLTTYSFSHEDDVSR